MSTSSPTASKTIYNGFSAVFLPTFLTLLSVGFFLRIGLIVGSIGYFYTSVIIFLAVLVTSITALSMSSTVSNLKIETGSVFFLLSRSFGVEVGSAISLPLFLAQALSTSFYALGFAEGLHLFFPFFSLQTIALAVLAATTLLVLFSSHTVLRLQPLIFTLVCVTMLVFYLGYTPYGAVSSATFLHKSSFWPLFAIFFPVVTGIEGGLSFINSLKTPSRSIPWGLLSAIITTSLIYLSTSYILSKQEQDVLLSQPLIMQKLSLLPTLVGVGILGSTLSAALCSSINAANSLKSFAEDGIIPKVFGNPHIAVLFSMMISFLGASLGNINAIAPLLSMFFLISYGTLNAATGIEALIHNPSWRPTFKTPAALSLLGSALCIVVMLLVDPAISLGAAGGVSILYLLMKKRHLHSSWEDMRYSILLFCSRYAIYKLEHLKASPKTWRPNLLVFVGDPLLRAHLTELTSALTHKKGFLIVSSIITSSDVYSEEEKLSLFLKRRNIPALIKTKQASNLLEGMHPLIEDIGLGHLCPNTIVLGASEKPEKIPLFADIILLAHKNKKNLIIIRENGLTQRLHIKDSLKQKKSINVWWGGRSKNNSELMLVMAHMLQTSEHWNGSSVTLKTVVSVASDIPLMQENLRSFVTSSRLELDTEIALHETGDIFSSTMKKHSLEADLVFLGIRPPGSEETPEEYATYYAQLLDKTANYPPIAYTLAGESLDFSKILS